MLCYYKKTGYPFNKGMEPRRIEKKKKTETPEEIEERERAEIMAQLHPKPDPPGELFFCDPESYDPRASRRVAYDGRCGCVSSLFEP